MRPPRYSRNRLPLYLRIHNFQLWLNEQAYIRTKKLRKAWHKLPFIRSRLHSNPNLTPRFLYNHVVLLILLLLVILLLTFGEGWLNRENIMNMVIGYEDLQQRNRPQ